MRIIQDSLLFEYLEEHDFSFHTDLYNFYQLADIRDILEWCENQFGAPYYALTNWGKNQFTKDDTSIIKRWGFKLEIGEANSKIFSSSVPILPNFFGYVVITFFDKADAAIFRLSMSTSLKSL